VGLRASAGRASTRPFWTLSLYPEAGEGGGCLRVGARSRDGYGEPDPDRAKAEAGRRARTKVRRYVVANRLNRFVTLTYAGEGCFDHGQLRSDVAGFFRGLRGELGGEPLPYLWVPEWHPGGHGLHVHFAVGRYVRRSLIESVWGRGWTHIKLIGDLPVGSGALEEARIAATYLAKYVAKNIADQRIPRLHRYEVGQGFQPEAVPLIGISEADVLAQANEIMGSEPSVSWNSSQVEGWKAPPAYWHAWSAG
jgi:hypothetical protein